jgi:hypothetical protein
MTRAEADRNRSTMWSDDAFGATEFLIADHRDFIFPPHLHETLAIGVIVQSLVRRSPVGRRPVTRALHGPDGPRTT